MEGAVDYRELAPPEGLRRYVRCFWHLTVRADAGHVQTVYPDGCCELIVHRGAPMHAFHDATGWRQQARCLFAGQQRTAVRLAARGDADCLGVRLQPAASAAVVKTALPGLRDRIVDLVTIDPAFAERLRAAALQADVAFAVARVSVLLEEYLPLANADPRIELAIAILEASQGTATIAEVIASSGMGERSFQGAFRKQVGLSAKEFARILRLQATIRTLDRVDGSVAELAIEHGFADQAHATRELRRVTGITPAKLREALRMDRDGVNSIRLAAAFVRGRIR